jgi:hypothetical protein
LGATRLADCRPSKETAKEAKLQVLTQKLDKEMVYTFLFDSSEPWAEMRAMRDILLNLMYKVRACSCLALVL